jgi:FAD-dependent urate hydroxylase
MQVLHDPGLEALSEQVRRELELLRYPERAWVEPRSTRAGAPIYDVVIVGAGQGGLATAFGLLRERISNVLVIDENPIDRAGPWLNFARMRTLRTPKYLTGPDLGLPSLTARAWYEAQHGVGSWESLRFLAREDWAAYLAWYRAVLALPVRADTRVGALSWDTDELAFRVPCETAQQSDLVYARRVVLATGIDGSGAWQVPAIVQALPRARYAHTREPIDFAALRGLRVAVLGGGASAFDNAAVALEHGAREVHMFVRRARLVDVNAYRWAEFVGFLKHFGDLTDAQKWRFVRQLLHMGQLPPSDTLERARAQPGFQLHEGASVRALTESGSHLTIETGEDAYQADFLIVGTGFVTDLSLRPELAALEPAIARWSDRYTPPAGERDRELAQHPYLGAHFEFIARSPEHAPYLSHLYNYTFGGLLSLGLGGASISGMKYSIPRLVFGITKSFFLEQSEQHFDALACYDVKEF